MPTFTDLYYSGPTNIGNPDLKPEKSKSLEAGIKMNSELVTGRFVVFQSKGENIIDWVKSENDELWQSMNHTAIQSTGIETDVKLYPWKILGKQWPGSFQFGYLYNNQKKLESELISFYVLDNLKHKFVASVNQPVFGNFYADIKFIYQDREGTYTNYINGNYEEETHYNPFWLVDTKIAYRKNNFLISVSASNLFNKSYFDLGNVVQPGRWLKAGIKYTVSFR